MSDPLANEKTTGHDAGGSLALNQINDNLIVEEIDWLPLNAYRLRLKL
jgi:hypothetical protein